MEHVDLKETSGVVLAYLGDAVWELCIRIHLSVSYGLISILLIGSLRSPPPIRRRRTSPASEGRIKL